MTLILAAVGLAWWSFRSQTSRDSDRSSSQLPIPATNSAAQTTNIPPEFQKLTGSWVRPDGGYVLEIRNVDASGEVDAAYFNPSPIHVSKARALRQDGVTHLFVELQDEGYPGCTYTLTYDPAANCLAGDYYQAAQREHYNIVFSRNQ